MSIWRPCQSKFRENTPVIVSLANIHILYYMTYWSYEFIVVSEVLSIAALQAAGRYKTLVCIDAFNEVFQSLKSYFLGSEEVGGITSKLVCVCVRVCVCVCV